MKILFVGDVFGRPGRDAVGELLPGLKKELMPDLIITNCENAAGGKGITDKTAAELFRAGSDILTGGNHIYDQRNSMEYIAREERLVVPLNFPPGSPGRGRALIEASNGRRVGVINACGRAFMGTQFDCPFRGIDAALKDLHPVTPIVIVDFHAETTSEKIMMGWYLDGRVTAVLGTHTHIPTADERILHHGTAYITDTGMTGPYDSVIGMEKEGVMKRNLTQLPRRFEVAPANEVALCGVLIECDEETGRATSIRRIRREM